MSIVPMPLHSRWVADQRGQGRGLRISSHPEAGVVVLSIWRDDECVATTRLQPAEAAQLAAGLAESLAQLATPPSARQVC
ncbi:hypothetical protein [Georgenia yuyongxinii]|uniref:Uncharacterized protein n=1 Tax=Georgenia yuyongxinii TaxID=2589797 RepID=A0A552WQ38_9MICO|nr:hypothetical protein [Georgenia yuyongxinii]TRW44901.1 hypothetical protein FJ693_11850 [Georgenia yuyongxinii]